MDYSKLVAITGFPGLFELVGKKGDGILVKNLDDNSVKFISSRSKTFTQLDGIEIFTIRENVRLAEVLLAMKASEEPLPSEKDALALKNYFTKVYPDLDFDRVYPSDMKKMVRWFAVVKQNDIEIKLPQVETEEEESLDEPAK